MKHLFIIGTLIAICFAQFAPSLVLFHFELNQAKIAAEKCVERDVPNSCCQGKCYLNDVLEKTSQPVDDHREIPSWVQWQWLLAVLPELNFTANPESKNHPLAKHMALLPGVQSRLELPPELL